MIAPKEVNFQPMLISDVFLECRQAPAWLNANQVKPGPGAYAHVTNAASGNSVVGFIGHQEMDPNPGNAITIGIDTQVVAYQRAPFYGATKVFELRSPNLNEESALVLVAALKRAVEKFSWGHKASAARLRKTRIMVPVSTDSNGEQVVDWETLREFGSGIAEEIVARSRTVFQTLPSDDDTLPSLRFAPMLITEVFQSMQASTAWYDKSKLSVSGPAIYPFISRTSASNGMDGFCCKQVKPPEPGNAITIGLDTQTIAYQPAPFYTSQNIQVLRHHKVDEYTGPVLVSLIKSQMGKFSWGGNGATLGRLRKTRIMVPVTTDDNGEQVIDWDGMSAYGLALRVLAERNISAVLVP